MTDAKPARPGDAKLGMDEAITRRDFLGEIGGRGDRGTAYLTPRIAVIRMLSLHLPSAECTDLKVSL
jgi:hypothetical protein